MVYSMEIASILLEMLFQSITIGAEKTGIVCEWKEEESNSVI